MDRYYIEIASGLLSFILSPLLFFLKGMKVFFLIVVALYILYLIFLIVRACSELKNMPYSGIRAHHNFQRSIRLQLLM